MNISYEAEDLYQGLNESSNDTLYDEDDTVYDVVRFYVVERTYIKIPLCTLGVIFNILNIVVFTRKRMRSSINFLLTCLAISDLTAIFFELGVPMITQAFLPSEIPNGYSTYTIGIISLIDYYVARWFFNVSEWITVTVAIWRCIAVTWPLRAQLLCTVTRAKVAIAIVVIVNGMLTAPELSYYGLRPVEDLDVKSSVVIYERYLKSFVIANDDFVIRITQYVYVFIRLTPSVILVFLTLVLVWTLYRASKVRRNLHNESSSNKSNQDKDRTTPMLLVVVVLFLISNMPYPTILTFQLALGSSFEEYIDAKILADFAKYHEIAVALNFTINFCIYYVMSHNFRSTFLKMFCSCLLRDSSANSICTTCPKIRLHMQPSSSSDITIETSTEENTMKLRNLSTGIAGNYSRNDNV